MIICIRYDSAHVEILGGERGGEAAYEVYPRPDPRIPPLHELAKPLQPLGRGREARFPREVSRICPDEGVCVAEAVPQHVPDVLLAVAEIQAAEGVLLHRPQSLHDKPSFQDVHVVGQEDRILDFAALYGVGEYPVCIPAAIQSAMGNASRSVGYFGSKGFIREGK